VYFTDIPLANNTPSSGMFLSITVLAVPFVLDLNRTISELKKSKEEEELEEKNVSD
jgi:hypothetical protein